MQISLFINPEAATQHARTLLTSDPALAVRHVRRLLDGRPSDPALLRLLGAALRRQGDNKGAERAEQQAIAASSQQPLHQKVAQLVAAKEYDRAKGFLQSHLEKEDDDVLALVALGKVHLAGGDLGSSGRLLAKAVKLAPAYSRARLALIDHFLEAKQPAQAIAEIERLNARAAASVEARVKLAAALSLLGRFDDEVAILDELIAENPQQTRFSLRLGHALKTLGRTEDAIAAYRKVLEICPVDGSAWWSLANLKTVKFDDDDIAAMKRGLDATVSSVDNRISLNFALGKAHEDHRQPEAAFRFYDEGNRLRASIAGYVPAKIQHWVNRCEQVVTADFFAERAGYGCPSGDPIFVVGMQRSGSTLVEQILASHPAVEGTAELNELPTIGRELAEAATAREISFHQHVARLSASEVRAIGETYLEQTRVHRAQGKPFFTDKMPNNWVHAALIRLALPNARIIDVRRHPLACGFSNWKQLYAKGVEHSYSLETMGLFYREYVRLMRHMDRVQPGAIHRVIYERMVDDLEGEVRRLLAYLGLPFDEACLAFHSTDRAVRTISAEQVRKPINRQGLDQWRPFEPWLDPLKMGLGPALEDWDR